MEQIELESVAFLILLEDVAAQAPGWSNDRTQIDVEGEPQRPAPQEPGSLTLHPNLEISALGRMRELLETTRPTNESSALRERQQPPTTELHLGAAGSINDVAQGPVDESLLLPAGDVSLLDESWPLTTDDYRSRSRLEADEQTVNPSRQRREGTSETILQDAETNSQATGGRAPYAITSAELHIPESDLTSLGQMPVAGDGDVLLDIGEGLKCVPPTDRVWPTHHSEPGTRETGSNDLLKSRNPDPSRASVAAPIASEMSTYAGSRTTQRRTARLKNQNRELARRIAWLEDQLGLKSDTGGIQDQGAYPRLCYPL